MRILFIAFLCLLQLPAYAGFFSSSNSNSGTAAFNNSADFLPVEQAFTAQAVENSDNTVAIRFSNADGYYLYRHRLSFSTASPGVSFGEPQLPDGEERSDEFFGDIEAYYGSLDIILPVINPDNLPYTLDVGYQGCADLGLCYPPEVLSFELNQPVNSSSMWTWQEIALFFLAGLGLTFTPCVLPMLPILTGVVLRGEIGGARSFVLSSVYVVSMALCFAVLGALMGVFGAELNIQARLQSPWVLIPFAAFFSLFALAMFGLFEMRLPQFISGPLHNLSGKTKGGSIIGAAVLGVFSSLLVSPCVSAPLAAALLYISASGDAWGGGLKLLALGLGMGAPLVLFATGGGKLLPKSGAWMLAVRNAFGVLLLAVALWLLDRVLPGPVTLMLWGALAAGVAIQLGTLEFGKKSATQKMAQLLGLALLVYALTAWVGALQGQSNPLQPLSSSSNGVLLNTGSNASTASNDVASASTAWLTITDVKVLQSQLEQAQQAGLPAIVDWYADWCISCKVIERNVLEHPHVRELFVQGNYQLLRLDITENTPEHRALLNQFQLFGPPVIQFFAENGSELDTLRVVGEVNATQFIERLNQAAAMR
ncbi:protein-disulfide reductase DsbD [Pseudomonas sp. C27(2019)]|uniref:protein-disulfide reductase DsbD n=1 Tax=Pseudomonas sp. C27(2019) TaxID=2604941 RepID=UPI0012453FD9|nr:protein-disulfide reductase DsbD [Pseudomonas sp. C27(2019)]QEY59492.1 protein-disulfide reductase DsbD [Pseudomonas sp. C27(2019)]